MSADTLVVFLGSTRAGEVTRAKGPTAFSYDPAYLASDHFIPVSLSFRTSEQPPTQRVTRPNTLAWVGASPNREVLILDRPDREDVNQRERVLQGEIFARWPSRSSTSA